MSIVIVSILAFALAVALVAIVVLVLRGGTARREEEHKVLSFLQAQMATNAEQSARRIEALNQTLRESLSSTNQTVGDRLDRTAQVIGDVRQKLGRLEESSRAMVDLGKDMSRLQDILRPPKLRGALGELFLADLLGQVLPSSHYELQHRFQGGETVDAVVRLRSGLVPIDAKFPLENLRRVLDAESGDDRKAARKVFLRDVKIHIDAIAKKYIRMDEGTFDFALMYIPAENVYYETIIKDDELGGEMALFGYALERRVIPVSPNSFYAYLQTIILGLKGMRVEEESRAILEQLSRVQKEFTNFADAFRLVGAHLDNSRKKFDEASRRFGKIEGKLDQINGLARDLEAHDAPAPPSLGPNSDS